MDIIYAHVNYHIQSGYYNNYKYYIINKYRYYEYVKITRYYLVMNKI